MTDNSGIHERAETYRDYFFCIANACLVLMLNEVFEHKTDEVFIR